MLGVILVVIGIALACVTVESSRDMTTAGADGPARIALPIVLLAVALMLVGLVLAVLAFAPGREGEHGPTPVLWTTVSRVFDGFWRMVSEVLRR